jgi:hypothetical protein
VVGSIARKLFVVIQYFRFVEEQKGNIINFLSRFLMYDLGEILCKIYIWFNRYMVHSPDMSSTTNFSHVTMVT